MKDESREIERNDLYSKVWSEPMTKLAPKYGISDVALKKICKKLNVPTPPRGYWAKVQNNILVERARLPKLKYGQPSIYEVQKSDEPDQGGSDGGGLKYSEEAIQLIHQFESGKQIKVPERLASPHPLVRKTRESLSKAKPDKYGVLRRWRGMQLDIRVSQTQLRRALLIMNAVVRFFEKHGLEIVVDESHTTNIFVFEQKVPICIHEPSRQVDHVLTEAEKKEKERYRYHFIDKYDYIPSGKLTLKIDSWSSYGVRKNWSDGKIKRIENSLMNFAVSVVKYADLKRTQKIEWQEEQRRWEEERQRQAELERLREMELQRRLDLENQADRWSKSKQLRLYIEAVKDEALNAGLGVDSGNLSKWLRWANEHADRIDPLKNSLPFENENV